MKVRIPFKIRKEVGMPPTTTSSYRVKEDKKKMKRMMIREIKLSLFTV